MSAAETQSIELLIAQTPSCALTDMAKKQELYAFLENEIAVFVPDLETDKGRKAIAALAYKIARTKTAIDDAGAKLKEDWLKKSRDMDSGRREIRDRLDALKDKAREPLTRWEVDEEHRQSFIQRAFDDLHQAVFISHGESSDSVSARLKTVDAYPLDPIVFRERLQAAIDAKIATSFSLRKSLTRILEDEFDREELARLRKESEERAEQDRKVQQAAEIARRAKEQEEARIQAEAARVKREAEIAEQAKSEAENRLRREFEESQRVERERLQAALDKEKKSQADAQAAHDREVERVRIENEKKAEADRKLAANKKHRASVQGTAEAALRERCQLSPKQAKDVVTAIIAGWIPAVTINFTGEAK